MRHLGTQTLHTPRLTLRPFSREDGAAMYRNWASDPEVTRFLSWSTHRSQADSDAICAEWAAKAGDLRWYNWAIVPNELGEPIGAISFHRFDEDTQMVHAGYCIGKTWWGRGYAAEALQAVIAYAFLELGANRVESIHNVKNPASGRVMEKCGMTLEGMLRQAYRDNSGCCDVAVRALLRQDWLG